MALQKRRDPNVTPADIDLTPLSVGFDLRAHDGMSTEVPDWARSMRYSIAVDVWRAEGTQDELSAELRAAGYRILGDDK